MALQPAIAGQSPGGISLDTVEARMCDLLRDPDDCITPVARAAQDHLASGGRRLRARLALAAGSALGLAPELCVSAAASVELLHNASLVHDDLQDREAERRGAATVWAAHGGDVALCTGDMLICAAFAAAAPLAARDAGALSHMHAAVAETIRGQTADRRVGDAPSGDIAGYSRMARAKSGPLIALPLELALRAAGRTEALQRAGKAGRHFAFAYQIHDDLSDTAADRRRGATNIIALLACERGLGEEQARAEAAKLADVAIVRARAGAEALPHGAGQGLVDAADTLVASLIEE